jgi:arylsulfatase
MKTYIKNYVGLIMAFLLISVQVWAQQPSTLASINANKTKPNVIIIMVDDAGYGDYSCHGNPVSKTPNVDKLHDESVRFSDFHVTPFCTPTRSQLLTGVDNFRNGASVVVGSRMLLRPDLPTAANIFAANGYRTGQFGKWHLGDNYPFRPQERGFQDVLYFNSAYVGESNDTWCNDYVDPWLRHADGKPVQYKGYVNDILFNESMTWMDQRHKGGEPFFCYLPLPLIHTPLIVPEKYCEPYKDQKPNHRQILGMLANVDENMGRLDAFLRQSGLLDNTILIFLNDNGSPHMTDLYNAGMRGNKGTPWEGGHRSPLFVRWPSGGLRPPGEVTGLAEVQDLLPTLIGLCGLKQTLKAKFDGINLAPVLKKAGQEPPDRTLIVQHGYPQKAAPGIDPAQRPYSVMWRRWRLVESALFNLDTDPGQQKDLIAEQPEIAAKLRKAYAQWWKDVEPWTTKRSAIIVGDDHENPLTLLPSTQHDQKGLSPDMVRNGTYTMDQWFIQVAQDGDYKITLRRWPEEANTAISATLPAWNSVLGQYPLPAGKAFPIVKARLAVGEFNGEKDVALSDAFVTFTLPLKQGQTMLRGTFLDDQGKEICGAYYVNVHRLDRVP